MPVDEEAYKATFGSNALAMKMFRSAIENYEDARAARKPEPERPMLKQLHDELDSWAALIARESAASPHLITFKPVAEMTCRILDILSRPNAAVLIDVEHQFPKVACQVTHDICVAYVQRIREGG